MEFEASSVGEVVTWADPSRKDDDVYGQVVALGESHPSDDVVGNALTFGGDHPPCFAVDGDDGVADVHFQPCKVEEPWSDEGELINGSAVEERAQANSVVGQPWFLAERHEVPLRRRAALDED